MVVETRVKKILCGKKKGNDEFEAKILPLMEASA
jgi:hypothetical protein